MKLDVNFNNEETLDSKLSNDVLEMSVLFTNNDATLETELFGDGHYDFGFIESDETLMTEFTDVTVIKEEVPTEGGTTDHNKLENRDLPNQHPIGSITGLQTALDGKQPKGNYLTEHQSLKGYATETWVQAQKYITQH